MDLLLGKAALQEGLITSDQLRDALSEQSRGVELGRARPRSLGNILMSKGYLSDAVVLMLTEEIESQVFKQSEERRSDLFLGQILIEIGIATREHVQECLELQSGSWKGGDDDIPLLGELLVQKGYASREEVAQGLELQSLILLECQKCRKQSRQTRFEAMKEVECPDCGGSLEPPLARAAELKAKQAEPAPVEKEEIPANAPRLGKYALIRELGRGGMGVVYKALDTQLTRKVALKLMHPNLTGDEKESSQEIERFVREAQLSAKLPKHPSIVSVYEAGIIDGKHFIAMELIDGLPISGWRKKGSITIRQQVKLLRDVALAVHHAHQQGIFHRDLKPANVLVDARNQPYVTDFGLAKKAGHDVSLSLTAAGMIVGTPSYMSPEQAQGLKSIDRRTDIYSMGVMLYEVLTGRPPFRGETPIEILMKVLHDRIPPPSEVARALSSSAVDTAMDNICMRALARRPADRYPSAKAFAEDLTRWIKGEDVKVEAPQRPGLPRWAMGAGLGVAAAAVAAVLLLLPSASSRELARADTAAREGLHRQALTMYDAILKSDPSNKEARRGRELAKAKSEAMELTRALAELKQTRAELEKARSEAVGKAREEAAATLEPERRKLAQERRDAEERARMLEARARKTEEQIKPADVAREPAEPAESKRKDPIPLPAPEAPAVALTGEAKTYFEAWESALTHLAARDVAAAVSRLDGASRDLRESTLRQEAAADLQSFRQAGALVQEGRDLVSKWLPGKLVGFDRWTPAGTRERVEGNVVRLDAFRMEIRSAQGAVDTVDFGEVTAASLGAVARDRAARKPDADAAVLLLHLVERDLSGAEAAQADLRVALPEKYWAYARSIPAVGTAHAEEEARLKFYEAEEKYFDPAKTLDAIAAFKALIDDHGSTVFVRRNRASVLSRTEGGKEFYLQARDLTVRGSFKLGRGGRSEPCWISEKDVDPASASNNYVQIDFSAAAGAEYRCWVLVGGCCYETLTFYYQGTEISFPNPKNPKELIPVEPGGSSAAPAKIPILNLKKLHNQHTGPKEPDRWEWIPIGLPRFASAGPKSLRLLTDQKGFSVAAALISATRQVPPKDFDIRELERVRADAVGNGTRKPASVLGSILREYWRGIPGIHVADLLRSPSFPEKPTGVHPLSQFEGPTNSDNDYGCRVRGYVYPPVTGSYVFLITSDDQSELWLSTDDSSTNRVKIAGVSEWSGQREWNKESSQTSTPVVLRADRRYYIEALHKQGSGGDHLIVGWRLPDGTEEKPIPGKRLSPPAGTSR